MSCTPFSRRWLPAALLLVLATRAQAHEGWGIVVDAEGAVTFADIPTNSVWRISPGGVPEKVVADRHTHALTLDHAGNLCGTDVHFTLPIRGVWCLASGGRLTDLIPPTDGVPLALQTFLIDEDGSVYSTAAARTEPPSLVLVARDPAGVVRPLAGGRRGHADGQGASARLDGVDGMAWAPDGSIHLTDGPFVRRVTRDGVVTTLGPGPLTEGRFDVDLMGLAVAADGTTYVADYSGRRVLALTGGEVRTVLRTGRIWSPTGVALAPDGLYLLEHLRMPLAILGDLGAGPYLRVRKVAVDGTVTELGRLRGRNSDLAAGSVVAVLGALLLGAAIVWRRWRGGASTRALCVAF